MVAKGYQLDDSGGSALSSFSELDGVCCPDHQIEFFLSGSLLPVGVPAGERESCDDFSIPVSDRNGDGVNLFNGFPVNFRKSLFLNRLTDAFQLIGISDGFPCFFPEGACEEFFPFFGRESGEKQTSAGGGMELIRPALGGRIEFASAPQGDAEELVAFDESDEDKESGSLAEFWDCAIGGFPQFFPAVGIGAEVEALTAQAVEPFCIL